MAPKILHSLEGAGQQRPDSNLEGERSNKQEKEREVADHHSLCEVSHFHVAGGLGPGRYCTINLRSRGPRRDTTAHYSTPCSSAAPCFCGHFWPRAPCNLTSPVFTVDSHHRRKDLIRKVIYKRFLVDSFSVEKLITDAFFSLINESQYNSYYLNSIE